MGEDERRRHRHDGGQPRVQHPVRGRRQQGTVGSTAEAGARVDVREISVREPLDSIGQLQRVR